MFIIKLLTFLSRKNANFMLSALLKYVILLQTDHFKSVFSEPTETAENISVRSVLCTFELLFHIIYKEVPL